MVTGRFKKLLVHSAVLCGIGVLASATVAKVSATKGVTVNKVTLKVPSLIVTTTQDVVSAADGRRSLREAITMANADPDHSVITFGVTGAIALSTAGDTSHDASALAVITPVTIQGPAGGVTITRSSAKKFRLFLVDGGSLTLNDLTLTKGESEYGVGYTDGGAIRVENGMLNLNRCTLTGNIANVDDGHEGIGRGNGGAVGVRPGATANITNCTISGNKAVDGGGVSVEGGTINLTNSTITGNTAVYVGGGLSNISGTLHVANSIVTDNTAASNTNTAGALDTNNHNLIDGDANLAPLADNGGPTRTHALLSGSPALDAGDDAVAPATDQRGLPRLVGSAIDIGALEVQLPYSISEPFTSSDGQTNSGVLEQDFSSHGVYSLSGRITSSSGAAMGGVTVMRTGSDTAVVTNSAGYYTFDGVGNGSYTITPSMSDRTFTPAANTVTISGTHVDGQNFIGSGP